MKYIHWKKGKSLFDCNNNYLKFKQKFMYIIRIMCTGCICLYSQSSGDLGNLVKLPIVGKVYYVNNKHMT